MLDQRFHAYLGELQRTGLYRQRKLLNSTASINFSANDYLSLREHKYIRAAYQRGFAKYPCGSGGSVAVCGYHSIHRDLERAFAEILQVDDALLFPSGYSANHSVIAALAKINSRFLIDKGVHASFYDGLKFSNIKYQRFLHNDMGSLTEKLTLLGGKGVVITESVFSMSGQQTPLKQLTQLGLQHNAECIVDEAHAFGILGPQGLGAIEKYCLTQEDIALRIIPFGKAFASQGAIIAGRGHWINAVLQSARSCIYSTAMSPALAYGILKTLAFIIAAEDRRQQLFALVRYFRQAVKKSPLNWRDSLTPIQQLQMGCPYKALECAKFLHNRGILCPAMRQPTVNKQETGLRVIINYSHEPEHIDTLFSLLHEFHGT